MNKGIYTFLVSKGISYTETSNPYDLLLNMDDAEEFLKIATKEHIAIIGADVYEKRDKNRYMIAVGLEWDCFCFDNENVTDDSYIDRSIKIAENSLSKIRDIIKERNKQLFKRNKQLFINYVFHDKDNQEQLLSNTFNEIEI